MMELTDNWSKIKGSVSYYEIKWLIFSKVFYPFEKFLSKNRKFSESNECLLYLPIYEKHEVKFESGFEDEFKKYHLHDDLIHHPHQFMSFKAFIALLYRIIQPGKLKGIEDLELLSDSEFNKYYYRWVATAPRVTKLINGLFLDNQKFKFDVFSQEELFPWLVNVVMSLPWLLRTLAISDSDEKLSIELFERSVKYYEMNNKQKEASRNISFAFEMVWKLAQPLKLATNPLCFSTNPVNEVLIQSLLENSNLKLTLKEIFYAFDQNRNQLSRKAMKEYFEGDREICEKIANKLVLVDNEREQRINACDVAKNFIEMLTCSDQIDKKII
jgi:hypothetical protein